MCSAQILIHEPLVDDSYASSGCLDIELLSVAVRDEDTGVLIAVGTECTNQWISLSKRMTLSYSGKENGIIKWVTEAEKTHNFQALDFDKKYTLEPNKLYFFILRFPPIPKTTKIISIHENVGANSFYWKGIHLNTGRIIGENTEIRHCAFIRGNAIIGKGAVVGNSTELKNVILFNKVQVPHYNYVGDSILGYKSHMGAGSITSNVKSDKTPVSVKGKNEKFETGLKKMGAILGDNVEVGCNSVLNPGTIIGQNSNIYPTSMVRGVVPSDSIYKTKTEIAEKYNK